jgi:hypothetical protein
VDEIEDFEDFREQMFWFVQEGAFLFELPLGARDHTRDGIVQHGPWPPKECSRCLLTWFDHGWIEPYVPLGQLYRWSSDDDLIRDPSDENIRIVETDRARAILAEPQTWKNDRPEGFVCLAPADHAPSSDFRQLWLDAISPPE